MLCDDGSCRSAENLLASEGRVFWVAQKQSGANDSNPGTKAQPWKTISRATQKGVLRPGDAVIVRQGVYREAIRPQVGGRPGQRITFAAYPGEDVIVTGADQASDGWAKAGNAWRRSWKLPLHSPRSKDAGLEMWRREMVVVDGKVLEAVYSRASLRPGTFFVEGSPESPRYIFVRFPKDNPPSSHNVEIASRAVLFGPTDARHCMAESDGTLGHYWLIGFTFRHAANQAQRGAICGGATGSLVEENHISWTNGMGANVSGTSHLFRANETSDNGQSGIGGVCDGCTLEYNVSNRNNWKNYPIGWEAGGGKMLQSRGTVFRHHTAIGNNGPGIWFDHLNFQNAIVNSYIADNNGHGIFLELESDSNLVAGNVLVGNRYRNDNASGNGVSVTASSHNLIAYNTFIDNGGSGISVKSDKRDLATDNHLYNNLFLNNAQATKRGFPVFGLSILGSRLSESRSNQMDGNAFTHRQAGRATANGGTFRYGPNPSGRANNLYTNQISVWQDATLGADNSLLVDGEKPVIVNENDLSEGWRIPYDSQLRGKAVALPGGWWGNGLVDLAFKDRDGHSRPRVGGDVGADQASARRAGGGLSANVALPEIVTVSPVNPDGQTFFGSLRVELRSNTNGAEIYYTLNGSEPTKRSPRYNSPLTLTEITTVKARAYKGTASSKVASAEFFAKAHPPEIQPKGGTFSGSVQVTLATATPGAEIYYTLDGSVANRQKQRYTGPFRIQKTATLKTAVYKPGLRWSNAQSARFTINAAADGAIATQRIELKRGWNLVSASVQPTDPRLESIFAGIKGDIGAVRNSAGQTYNPQLGMGKFSTWKPLDVYAIYARRKTAFTLKGQTVSSKALPLQAGWNLVPYTGDAPMPVEKALGSLGQSLVLIKDENGQMLYTKYGINTLREVKPNRGYQVYVTKDATLTYPDP